MKLEAVNPVDPEEVCIATVTKLKDSYLWLQLEGKLDVREERSSCIDSPVVPSSNLKSIWTNSLPAEYGQQITISLMKTQQKPICIVCFLVSLGWRCLFKAGKSGICAFQCVSARLVCCVKCWWVSFRKHFYKWVTCILRKLWPDLGRKLLETFFIKIE